MWCLYMYFIYLLPFFTYSFTYTTHFYSLIYLPLCLFHTSYSFTILLAYLSYRLFSITLPYFIDSIPFVHPFYSLTLLFHYIYPYILSLIHTLFYLSLYLLFYITSLFILCFSVYFSCIIHPFCSFTLVFAYLIIYAIYAITNYILLFISFR
jgi:hypothetical protein